MSPTVYVAQTGHTLGSCNLSTCSWQGACATFLPLAALGSGPGQIVVAAGEVCFCGCPAAVHIVRTAAPPAPPFLATAPISTPAATSARIPSTSSAPTHSTSSAPPPPLRPPSATASKSSLQDVLKSFGEAAARRAARRDDGNPRHENTNPANDKKRKSSATATDGRGADTKRSRSTSTQSKKLEEKLIDYRVVLVPRTSQVHEGRYRKPDLDTLNRLSEAGLALKIALGPNSTPSQINDRIRALFTAVFDDPILFLPPASDFATTAPPWCLLLGEAAPHLGDKVKILRPTTRKHPVAMDDIEMSMTTVTQYRMEGGGSGWKRVFWIALAFEQPDIILPSSGETELKYTYSPRYSDDEDEDAPEEDSAEDGKASESDEDPRGDSGYKGRGSRREASTSPPRKSSRVKKPTVPIQRVESDEDKANQARHGPSAADPASPDPKAPPPGPRSTKAVSPRPSPSPTFPSMTDAAHDASMDPRPSQSVKPAERPPSPSPFSPPRTRKAPSKEGDGTSPLHLNWEEIVAGVRSDLAFLWRDIRNICDPVDASLSNYFPLSRPADQSEWGSALRAAEDFNTLHALLEPKIHPAPHKALVSLATQLIDFAVRDLYPSLHVLAFGNSNISFGPYGLHTIVKAMSKLVWAFQTAIPHRTLSILQLSGVIKRLQAAVSTFRLGYPRSKWDPSPFRPLQVLLEDDMAMSQLPLAKGKSARALPVIDGANLPSPEALRNMILTYYGTLDDATAFPSRLITIGSEGLEPLLSRVVRPFLDADVILLDDEFLSEPSGPYKVMRDILGTLCEALATRLELEVAKATNFDACPPSRAASVQFVSSDSPSPPDSKSRKPTVSVDSDSELTPPPPPPAANHGQDQEPTSTAKGARGWKWEAGSDGEPGGQEAPRGGQASRSSGPNLRHRAPKTYKY
ncbi:hypothetical protein FS837_004564 [Tulasnella sp. UAMH 9824]|nr:hypothetical protein FS837_004564 [Tulasnella sp. UAMH 9824]